MGILTYFSCSLKSLKPQFVITHECAQHAAHIRKDEDSPVATLRLQGEGGCLSTFTTPRWRCGSILLPSLNAGVPEIIERVIYIIYMSSSWHHILAISPKKIEIYRVGDNRGTVNTSTSPHISDQLGTEYVCLILLC